MSRLNKPWVHFVLLGACLFYLQGLLFPEPKTTIGPISEARMMALVNQWNSQSAEPLTEEQRAGLITAELDRDLLFQRAIELNIHLTDGVVYQRLIRNMHFLGIAEQGSNSELFDKAVQMQLHLDDEVVKRRLIQVMKQRLLAESTPVSLSESRLIAELEKRAEEYRIPPRYSIRHLFFPPGAEEDLALAIEAIRRDGLGPDEAQQLGAPFLQGFFFESQTPSQLARTFGWDFARELESSKPVAQRWLGPIQSSFGWHYVWIDTAEPAREAALEDVETQLRRDLEYELQAKALSEAIEQLRNEYQIIEINRNAEEGGF